MSLRAQIEFELNFEKEASLYLHKTRQGYEIEHLIADDTGDLHAIVKRAKDYCVGVGYNPFDGTWRQGLYCYATDVDAILALNRYHDDRSYKIMKVE